MSFQYPEQAQQEPEKTPMDPTLIIAGALILLVLIGGIALAAAFIMNPAPPKPQPTVSYDIPTAREAYPAALGLIRAQDAGALLVTAEGAWTPNINMTQLGAGRTGWTFFFYLPAKGEMASVIADTKNGVRIATDKPWQTPPKVLDDRSWVADSSIGVKVFLDKCGGEIHDDRDVIARMSTASENGTLLWQYQVRTPDKNVVCESDTDARTGQPK